MKNHLLHLSKKLNDRLLVIVLVAVSAVIMTTLAIYLTPLKHLNIVPPVMREMDPAAFNAEFMAHPDEYVFIDVRSPNIYQSAHAKGSTNIPIENLFDEHYNLPKSGKKIALICTTGRLAAVAYGYLENWGFTNLIHIQGGMANWTYEGLPLEGSNVFSPASDEHQ